jgi:signal transduction histidine kinase
MAYGFAEKRVEGLDDAAALICVRRLLGLRTAVVTGVVALTAVSPLSAERLPVRTSDDVSTVPLVSEQRRHAYLIIKEALTNVVRHAHATNVVVLVRASHGRLRIEVTDDGVGLNGKRHDGAPGPSGGHGLENMQRRAAALGGTARIESAGQGRGTRIVVDVPLAHPHVHAIGPVGRDLRQPRCCPPRPARSRRAGRHKGSPGESLT